MKVLVFSTSTNNTPNFVGSLIAAGGHDVSVVAYDAAFHQFALSEMQKNPSVRAQIESGQWCPRRDKITMDGQMLTEANLAKPDVIVYISAWRQPFLPLNETLGELNAIAPMIHFLSDGADPPWWPELYEYDRRGVFSLTVNIDGCHKWPGGHDWVEPTKIRNAMTLLTPVDARFYPPPLFDYSERPYAIGYAGNSGGHFRATIVSKMKTVEGFAFKERDMDPRSYGGYADFLRHCRVSISVPFTGSGVTRHVKGRVLETAYAGATLLEWANPVMEEWFIPRFEYEVYHSVEECAEMARWLAGHPKRAADIARALQRKVTVEHSPLIFWTKVFQALGK